MSAVVLGLYAALFLSAAASADCKACKPQDMKPIAVLFNDVSMFGGEGGDFNPEAAEDFLSAPSRIRYDAATDTVAKDDDKTIKPVSLTRVTINVNKVSEIPAQMKAIADRCYRIVLLGFFTHGNLGRVKFSASHTAFNSENVQDVFSGVSCAMAGNARVKFAGCNVGRGCRGEAFLTGVAAALLSKGGRVSAATNVTYSAGPFELGSIDFNETHLRVGPNLHNPTWFNDNGKLIEPVDYATCKSRARDTLAMVYAIESRVRSCAINSVARDYLEEAKTNLEALGDPRFNGAIWSYPSKNNRIAWNHLARGYSAYELARAMLKGIGPCGADAKSQDHALPQQMRPGWLVR